MEQKITEFGKFRESERPLTEIGVLFSYIRDNRFKYSNPFLQIVLFFSLNSLVSEN